MTVEQIVVIASCRLPCLFDWPQGSNLRGLHRTMSQSNKTLGVFQAIESGNEQADLGFHRSRTSDIAAKRLSEGS